MYPLGSLKKIQTFLLLFITLHMTVHTFTLALPLFDPLKAAVSAACTLSTEENDTGESCDDFKPPKHSFIDYASYFSSGTLTLAYLPHEERLSFADPFSTPPKVYFDIFTPPQNLA